MGELKTSVEQNGNSVEISVEQESILASSKIGLFIIG